MSPCPVCGQAVDPLRSRAVAVRMGKVTAYCSQTCLDAAQTNPEAKPPIAIASTAPAKRDDTIGTWAIGDDTAIRKYSVLSTAEREVLPPAKNRRTTLVLILLVVLVAASFAVYLFMIR